MNDELICEWARAGARGLVRLFAVVICCIRSDACFFRARWPLIVSVAEPTSGSKK
jgi:hypothetical protein